MFKSIKLSIVLLFSALIIVVTTCLAQSTPHKILFRRNAGNAVTDGELCEMNPDGSKQKRLIAKFDGLGLAISPDRKLLAFSSGQLNSWIDELFVMNIETHNVRRVTDKLHYVYNPAFSPDSKQIAVMTGYSDPHGSDHEFHISIVDISSAKITQLTKGPEDWDPSYSPDGERIVFSSGELASLHEDIPQK